MGFRTATQAAGEVTERTKPSKKAPADEPSPPKKVNALKVMSSLAGGLLPDQKYIQDGLRNGTITKQSVGMKSIVVDTDFQARVPQDTGKHFNMEHVRKLAAIRDADDGKPLAPIVLFLDRKARKYYIADGFHRHEENRLRKCQDISAYVVEVDDWRHEAMLFAATCNQEMCLPRKPDDIRKAVEMVLADAESRTWDDARIAAHCGLSSRTVNKYRAEYNKAHDIEDPEVVFNSKGRSHPYRLTREPKLRKIYPKAGAKPCYRLNIGGAISLGSDERIAEEKAKSIIDGIKSRRGRLDGSPLADFFSRRGFDFPAASWSSIHSSYPGLRGRMGHGVVFTYARFDMGDSVPWAVGCLHMLRSIANDSSLRMVCLCVPEDAPQATLRLARKLGVEFLTPDELVASLKGD